MKQQDKYLPERERIRAIFEENHRCYGYRRIHAALRNEGLRLSEKVVRRLMKLGDLQVAGKKKRNYISYQGEITPAAPNILQRNFHADMPNKKWLTDITEFAIPAGKVYLSPVIDCFDGLLEKTNLRVSEVAYESGFSNSKYFSVVFKSSTGISALEYRRIKRFHSDELSKGTASLSEEG